jgi:2-polyprenyl-3-methyl-5-hydroxy-6-metoxy-1,4-benzoquinol methylase
VSEAQLDEEARAFDARIRARVAAGFIPDVRRAVKCEHFYKSFWRDPQFIDLYVTGGIRIMLDFLRSYSPAGARVLDAGCGTGYVGLELARYGYHVKGIDISVESIDVAGRMREENPFRDGFGSLDYEVCEFLQATGAYDVVLFSGVLHHLDDCQQAVDKARALLATDGLLICREPCHRGWRREDAAQVALIRSLLSLTGMWYDEDEGRRIAQDEDSLAQSVDDILEEYVEERDKKETGQSPKDNSWDGDEILRAVGRRFRQLEYRPGEAYMYRVLGGLRGDAAKVAALADMLAMYDRFAVKRGYLKPNYFYYAGRALP